MAPTDVTCQVSAGADRPAALPELPGSTEITEVLGVSVVHARRLMAKGRIPSRKFGRSRPARREDFLKLFAPDHPRFRYLRQTTARPRRPSPSLPRWYPASRCVVS